MSAVAVKGWCPGALRPMRSGDGLVVRIRPRGGRLGERQAACIAELSNRYGNGLIDVTSRANLQIRGVDEPSHERLLEELARFDLLDPDPDVEARRNVLVTPFWSADDEAGSLAAELERALMNGPSGLPTKFGFAIDCGQERVLAGASADVRIERDSAGRLMVRADGAELGRIVTKREAVGAALAVADWFVSSGGVKDGRGRMAAHIGTGARLPSAVRGDARPAPTLAAPQPGLYPQGAMIGVAFGQLTSAALLHLAGSAPALRMTPWRMILAEGLRDMPCGEGLVASADDPVLRVVACSGAPRCLEAYADTRALASALAPKLTADARLHVSGCAKGCAQSAAASITLIATRNGFDLVRNGSTRDTPIVRGLSHARILADPSIVLKGH